MHKFEICPTCGGVGRIEADRNCKAHFKCQLCGKEWALDAEEIRWIPFCMRS